MTAVGSLSISSFSSPLKLNYTTTRTSSITNSIPQVVAVTSRSRGKLFQHQFIFSLFLFQRLVDESTLCCCTILYLLLSWRHSNIVAPIICLLTTMVIGTTVVCLFISLLAYQYIQSSKQEKYSCICSHTNSTEQRA